MNLLGAVKTLEKKLGMEYDWKSGSMEAINFQANSAMPGELVKQFDRVFDFINNYELENGTPKDGKDVYTKHESILKFIEGTVGIEIKKIVSKYTMLTKILISSNMPITFGSAIDMYFETDFNLFELDELFQLSEGKNINFDIKSQIFKNVSNTEKSFDKVFGTISKNLPYNISINIPVGMFIMSDIIKDGDKFQLSSKEITAVFLHELGHFFTFIEYSCNLLYTGYYGNNMLQNISAQVKNNPKEVVANLIKNSDADIATIKTPSNKKIAKNIVGILKRCNGWDGDDVNPNIVKDTYLQYGLKSAVEEILIMTFAYLIMSPLIVPIMSAVRLIDQYKDDLHLKSREYGTSKQSSQFERLADEYVSRYGMSKELNSALIKFEKFQIEVSKLGFNSPMYKDILKYKNSLLLICRLLAIPSRLMFFIGALKIDGISFGYEQDLVRLKRNIANLHDIIKDKNLDPAIRNSIINDIDEMEEMLRKNKSNMVFALFSKVLATIINAPETILITGSKYVFGSAGMDKEYFQLLEHLDDMLSNKSFYYSAKIGNLFK